MHCKLQEKLHRVTWPLVIKMVFITNGTNSIYVIVISVVGIAFQNVAQDVPETQNSVLIPIVLTGNRAVPITFA